MIVRSLTFLCSALLSVSSYASFELLMVADNGTNSIHRFDPISNVYLGSFANGFVSNITSIAVDKNAQKVYVAHSINLITAFNPYTGAIVDSWAAPFSNAKLAVDSNGNVLAGQGASVRRINAQTHVITDTWSLTPGVSVNTIGQASNGIIYVGTDSGVNGLYFGLSNTSSSVLFSQNWFARNIAFQGTRSLNNWHQSAVEVDVNSSSNVNAIGGFSSIGSYSPNITGVAWGHGNIAYACGISAANSNAGVIIKGDASTLVLTGSFGSNILVSPVAMGSIVAPEPTSIATLGVGILALLRLRKKTAK